ncbi:MAG: hypothetical protein JO288_22055 [Hyphomicrobiales bacterium]|nr:hypothetical protein [Hyphomicrobiales bacterium]
MDMDVKNLPSSPLKATPAELASCTEADVHGAVGAPRAAEPQESVPRFFGILDAAGFNAARSLMPELHKYADYSDWLDVREGAQIGLAMVGVLVRIVRMDLDCFVSWCEAAGLPPSESELDEYAATLARSQTRSQARPY